MSIINNNKGVTLIEALIAMVVLTISLLGLSAMQGAAIRGNSIASHLTSSSISGSDRIEQLLNVPFNDALLNSGDTTHTQAWGTDGLDNDGDSVADEFDEILPKSINSMTWSVTDWGNDATDNNGDGNADDSDEQGIKEVIVTINYKSSGGTKSTQLQFLRTQVF